MPIKTKKLLFVFLTLVCLVTVLVPAKTPPTGAPPRQSVPFSHRHGFAPQEGAKHPFTVPPWRRPETLPDGSVPSVPQYPEPHVPKEDDGLAGRHAAAPHPPRIGEERPIPPPHTRASYRAVSVVWGMVIGLLFAAAAIRLGSRIGLRKREKHFSGDTKE